MGTILEINIIDVYENKNYLNFQRFWYLSHKNHHPILFVYYMIIMLNSLIVYSHQVEWNGDAYNLQLFLWYLHQYEYVILYSNESRFNILLQYISGCSET